MPVLEYAYFNVYQYYSRQSYFPNSSAVRLKCMYLLSLSAGGWILFLQSLFFRFIRKGWFTSHGVAMTNALIVYIAITILFYRIFILEERDQKIFEKYIDSWETNPNKKRDFYVTLFLAAMPYVSMFGVKLFLRR